MSPGDHASMVSMIFGSLAAFVVLVRIGTRLLIVKHVGVDDYLMIAAVVFSCGLLVTIELQRSHGLSQHIATLLPEQIVAVRKALFASIYLQIVALVCAKDSILTQFLRFFQGRFYRSAAWFTLFFTTLYGVIVGVAMACACKPLEYFWDRSISGGQCFNLLAFWFANSAAAVVIDLMLCMLPLPVLWGLRLPRRQKYSLLLVFMLGGFGCVAAVARIHAVYVIGKSMHPAYDNLPAAMWASIELNTCIICGSLPTLRPLVHRLSPRLLQSSQRMPRLDVISPSPCRQRSKDIETMAITVGGSDAEDDTPHIHRCLRTSGADENAQVDEHELGKGQHCET